MGGGGGERDADDLLFSRTRPSGLIKELIVFLAACTNYYQLLYGRFGTAEQNARFRTNTGKQTLSVMATNIWEKLPPELKQELKETCLTKGPNVIYY